MSQQQKNLCNRESTHKIITSINLRVLLFTLELLIQVIITLSSEIQMMQMVKSGMSSMIILLEILISVNYQMNVLVVRIPSWVLT